MRVGIYARVSKAEAQERETSVPVQLADCRERASEEGWTVVDEYADTGISAWNPKRKRPEYERLLDDVRAGRIDTILVREGERLLRTQHDSVRIRDLAEAGKLQLIASTLESDINFRRARDQKEFRDRASSAEFYSAFLSEKVRRTKASRKTENVYQGGGPAFGYTRTKDGLIINPKEAALIHGAVKRLGEGASLYRLTQEWNDAGITTANGKRWQPTGVRRLLAGEHLTGGNGYPAILTEVEAAIVRSKLPRPGRKTGRPPGRRYAATGLLFCAECGTKLTTSPGRYRCSVSHGGCGKVSIEATRVERYLVEEGVRHLKTSDPEPEAEPVADTSPILQELREVEQQLSDITEALGNGTLMVAVAGPASNALEERRRALTEALAAALPPTKPGKGIKVIELANGDTFVTDADTFIGPLDEQARDFVKRWERRELTGNEWEAIRDTITAQVERADVIPGRLPVADRVTVTWR